MSKNVDVLRARHSAKVTQQVKNKIWADISKTVSAVGKQRIAEQCRESGQTSPSDIQCVAVLKWNEGHR